MERAGLYVHVPFCVRKCAYCDFVSYPGREALHARYVAAVLAELAQRLPVWTGTRATPVGCLDTLFVGGGTPTSLPTAELCRLIAALRPHLSADAEVTVEANPGTVDAVSLDALAQAGVNRLSLGVQSLDDGLLRLLGRVHSAAEAVAACRAARAAGFENISLDLMYGLPLQSLAQWRATLEAALALQPEHLSLYALSLEEGTPLATRVTSGACPAPDDALAADMYELASALLDRAGYAHYEISNWARRSPGDGRDQEALPLLACRHNLGYWRNEPYLGLGVAAHSYIGRERTANTTDLDDYLARIADGLPATVSREATTRDLELAETMMLGLRLMVGVTWEAFATRFGADLRALYGREIERLCDEGLLEADARGIRLTQRGYLLGNRVFGEFLR
ncbi:MAG: radical SAM family heme chaperone HemW [Chloroflexi bacterium]|nr:radical SAM family heme chaperone HemW [Chloroflexota bacterium]